VPKRRSRSVRRSASPRRKADWVYRGDAALDDGSTDDLGTYSAQIITIPSGQATRSAFVLYDSQNYTRQVFGPSGAPSYGSRAYRAEGARPLILRVQAEIYMEPTVWAVGNIIAQGFRILVDEQDPVTGLLLQNPSYTMWAPNVAGHNPAEFANERNWPWERRVYKVFNLNSDSHRDFRIDIPMRRRLLPHQALWLYTEGESTGVNVRMQIFARSLVVDEG